MMRVLVACEFSQIVTTAFLEYGCDAYSCDLLPTIGDFPSRHFQCDVREILFDNWDLVIAHPPCTYLSNAGARYIRSPGRFEKAMAARDFFMMFYNLPGRVCIENPMPSRIWNLPKQSFIVNPCDFGDPYTKKTYLWLRRLPPFMCTSIVEPLYSLTDKYHDARRRSIFSLGIAKAMAEAWHDLPVLEADIIYPKKEN